jgi:hypothetical protein
LNINRKRKLGTNSKESPDWFHIAPEWKESQFREHLAKNEDSIKILSKHQGWISISSKTNNRKSPLEKFTFDKEKHRNIMPNWMNLKYYKNHTKDEDIFKKVQYFPSKMRNKKMMLLIDKNLVPKITNKSVLLKQKSIFNLSDFRHNVRSEEERKYNDNLVSQKPKKFFDWDDGKVFDPKIKKDI